MQWVLEHKAKYNIRVMNLSLNGTVEQSYHTSPLNAAVEILWFNGIVVVVSAGNNGTANLFPPANDPFVITVGATTTGARLRAGRRHARQLLGLRGHPRRHFSKPELVAPGVNTWCRLCPPANHVRHHTGHATGPAERSPPNCTWRSLGHLDVAAPMVAGAAALLLQDEPGLTPDQVKFRLMSSNRRWPGYDAGRAGVKASWSVTADGNVVDEHQHSTPPTRSGPAASRSTGAAPTTGTRPAGARRRGARRAGAR